MAVTTRNRGSPAKPTAAATKKAAPKQSKKAAAAAAAESSEDEKDQDNKDQDNEDKEEQSEDDSEEEDTFKIHTPKATTTAPRVIPAALPTIQYEDDSDDDEEGDSDDEAPEAESLSSAKAKIQSAQDKEKSFLSKVQAEQKAKRVEREQKLKEQKDQSKAKKKTTTPAPAPVPEESTTETTKATGLPAMLPMDILESVAQMDDTESNKAATNDKKRKHMRPEDFALMELEAELKAEALKRKRTEKKQKNIGPVTVKVLDKSHLAQGHAIPQTVVDFRQQHFYGSKIQRKDAILNSSQRSQGPAKKFNRK
ncbi:hypothetical protein BGZ95_008700 [Linnemannia exigua]|uniref:Uncharacterized protein n=1 Tax=Linnemannia exigua TaxID=604196 RepID=A0AAD4DFZ1_9FUNG|nr:hypothetical protein BGZ95_008700 [Linnemannia exigua]